MTHAAVYFESYPVLGVPVSATTPTSALQALHSWADDDIARIVCVRDVHGIMLARKDPELLAIHHEAAMVTPDGMPLVWLGRMAGYPVERTAGADLMKAALEKSIARGLRHYFFGGKDGVAQHLQEVLEAAHPGIEIVGAETPPFRPLSETEVRDLALRVNSSGADILWIGLSTPKQEYLMRQLAPFVHCTILGVGAAYDFLTGAVERAPLWVQRSGLEWLHRLASEPRRLWRRYLVLAPQFVWLVLLDAVLTSKR